MSDTILEEISLTLQNISEKLTSIDLQLNYPKANYQLNLLVIFHILYFIIILLVLTIIVGLKFKSCREENLLAVERGLLESRED